MQNKVKQVVKATISSIIVALLITGVLMLLINLFFGQKIEEAFSLVNKVSININQNGTKEETTITEETEKKNSIYMSYII